MKVFANIHRHSGDDALVGGVALEKPTGASAPHQSGIQHKRGTILIFVVAILALLAVMGTSYLLMARMDRTNTRIESEAINMDYGRESILNMVREIMYDCATDGNGNILNHLVGTGGQAAQYYDYPGGNEAWLTAWGPNGGTSRTVTAPSVLTPMGYDPSTNAYDISLSTNAFVMTPYGTGTAAAPAADGDFQLLSFSTAAGVRFRSALDIEDSCSRANLNVGNMNATDSDASGTDPLLPYGAYYAGVYMGNTGIISSSDTVSAIHNNNSNYVYARSRAGGYNLQNWLIAEMTMEMPNLPTTNNYGITTGNGTTGIINSGGGSTTGRPNFDYSTFFYDLTDELEMRSFGIQGLNYVCRPAAGPPDDATIWPNTCGAGSWFRDYWTSYSWVRNYRGSLDPSPSMSAPMNFTPYTFNGGQYIWPTYPRKIGVNPNLGPMPPNGMTAGARPVPGANDGQAGSNNLPSQPEIAAIVGVNMATAMQAVGYTQQEALSFAVNYMTYRTESGTGGTGNVRYSQGPAWIDSAGIHVPVGSATTVVTYPSTGANDIKVPAGTMYMGYIAQPFLTQASAAGTLGLANPYPYALDVTNYQLLVNGASTPIGIASVPAGSTTTTVAAIAAAGSGTVQLQRTYNNGAAYYTVDSLAIGGSRAAPTAPLYDRYNDNTSRVDGRTHIAQPAAGGLLYNITDFNRIGRMCNIVTSSGTDAGTCISAQSPTDSALHFDFLNDTRAIALLDYIDTTNRADDPTIIVSSGFGYWDISKLRLPGRINLNTAMAPVLQALPYLSSNPTVAQTIINKRPFQSMRDVLGAVATAGATSIDARDQVWGDIFNACTTRSDTFVVYGYMEAVRPNPASTTFNNSTNWYDTTAAGVTDDPNYAAANPSVNLIRVSRRRFLAVIDRSFANISRPEIANAIPWSSSTQYVPGNIVSYYGNYYQCVPPLIPHGQATGGGALATPGTLPTNAYYFVPLPAFTLPRVVALKDMPY